MSSAATIDPETMRAFCVELLSAASVFEVDAECVADALIWGHRTGQPEDGLALLSEMTLPKLEDRAGELALHGKLNHAYRRLRD